MSKQIHRTPTSQHKVRFHVLAIGLVLVGINSYWILMGSEVWHSTQLTIASLFFNAVFTLLVLSMVNFVDRKCVVLGKSVDLGGRRLIKKKMYSLCCVT